MPQYTSKNNACIDSHFESDPVLTTATKNDITGRYSEGPESLEALQRSIEKVDNEVRNGG